MVLQKGENKNDLKTILSRSYTKVAVAIVVVFFVFVHSSQQTSSTTMDSYLLRATSSTVSVESKSKERRSMKEWRQSSKVECKELIETIKKNFDSTALDKKENLERSFINKMTLNAEPSATSSASKYQPYRRCRNSFIDLGTNIGDSVGYFIDNSIDVCSPLWAKANPSQKFDANFPRPHIDVATLEIEHRGSKPNPLFGLLQRQSKKSPAAMSENFCVYGMEGNPEFTNRLTKLEDYISAIYPRPVQHIHIFKESVVTAIDGPTKLFLDKTSVKENFWGSSILSSQQDAVKSAKELNGGKVFSADVTGISLSTMVRSTMLAMKEDASPQEQSGGLLIIKMDVEGAEYQVLKEVAASGVLCKLKELGNRVVFVVEYHNMSITDGEERRREKKGHAEAVEQMKKCGVEFEKLHAHWA